MRELQTVHLEEKTLLSAGAACYHLRFRLSGTADLAWAPGQFLSFIADTPEGKTYTRAYSLASAPGDGVFDLCVNRVPGGFFSNLLCDLQPGAGLQCHGPHGLFTPKGQAADGLLVAEGTGIAPFRSFVQWLFPAQAPSRAGARTYSLLYSARSQDELFYDEEFRALAQRETSFRYTTVVETDTVAGLSTLREGTLASLAAGLLPHASADLPAPPGPASPSAETFAQYAYLCGLADLVKPARAQLLALGWQRRQVLFERYD